MLKLGLFINDYESAGSGISKNAPKKTGFKLFLDILGRKFWKLAGLNLLYFMFFMPLLLTLTAIRYIPDERVTLAVIVLLLLTFAITIGPATAGMTRVIRCYLIEKHAFVTHDFFKGFKANFKKAAVIGFIDCIIALSAFAAVNVYPALAVQMNSKLMYVPLVITYSFALVVLMMNYYIYLMLVATNLSLKNLIKNSFALAFVSMKNNLITTLLIGGIIALLLPIFRFAMPLFMTILPFYPAAFIAFVVCFNSYPVIQKYVINPYYESIGQINPELTGFDDENEEETVCEDMGGKENPIEKRKKGKGRRIS